MKKPDITIIEAIETIFARWFAGDSWRAWRVFLAALFGLPMDEQAAEIFKKYTNRATGPTAQAKEAWLVVGRRGGKSLIAAFTAVFLACFRDYRKYLGPGEVATVMVIAADRRQARVIMRYIGGFLDGVGMLSAMVTKRTTEGIELQNRVVIEVHTASYRAVRGYTIVAAIADEIAFWRSDESANPDSEILAAIRPALATIPGSMLLCISSPYARRGALWQAYSKHFGKDADPVLVWQADTLSMNPSITPSIIEQAYEEDESSARAEYGAEFRRDIETYISKEAVDAVTIPGRRELPYSRIHQYFGFVDPSGGSNDSMTLAISHRETINAKDLSILDLVREIRPPFSPESATAEFAQLLQSYGISTVKGDRYAGEFPRELFRKCGITYETSDKTKSEIYQALLPLLNSQRVELLDHPRLISQLCNLERRTARSGRDSIDHAPLAHDDVVNAAAGALVAATGPRYTTRVVKIVGF